MGRKLKGRFAQGKGLKGALQNHIVREKAKSEELKSMADQKQLQLDKAKSMKSGGAKKRKPAKESVIKQYIPFESTESLLLVGEGDFSFARSLLDKNLILPENLIATGFDSEAEMLAKYPESKDNVDALKESGVNVLHQIDATNLAHSLGIKTSAKSQGPKLFENGNRLNYIMFNFPHNGRGIKDMDRNIREHQKLVLGYFHSCVALFDIVNKRANTSSSGYSSLEESKVQKIVLTLFEGEPYISWGVKTLGRSVNYRVERSGALDWSYFEGYQHRRTNSTKETTKPAAEREARIYLFDKSLTKEEFAKLNAKKKKRLDDDDSDDE